jgi:hypothetical protein
LTAKEGFRVWLWTTPRYTTREQLAALLFHDVALEAEYAICRDQGTVVEPEWWEALLRGSRDREIHRGERGERGERKRKKVEVAVR